MGVFFLFVVSSFAAVLEAQTMPRPTKPGELVGNVTVRFVKFSNPGHLMASGQRCDSGWFSSNKCDPHMTACFLKPETAWSANATSKSVDECDFAGPFSSGPYDNTGEVVFGNAPGLFQKSIVMSISQAWHGVMLHVRMDEMERSGFLGANTAKGPLMDNFSYFFNGRPAASTLKLKLTGLTSANTSLELEAKIQCLPNYYDPKCSTFCVPSPTDHFTCDHKTGQIVCSPGWTGEICNAKVLSDHMNIHPFELGSSVDEAVIYEMEPVNVTLTAVENQLGENQTVGSIEPEALLESSTHPVAFDIQSAVVTEIVPAEDVRFEPATTDEPHFAEHQGSEVIFESQSSNVTAEAVTSGVPTIRSTYSSVWPLTVSLVVGGLSYLATTTPSVGSTEISGTNITQTSTEKAETINSTGSELESTTAPIFLDELVTLPKTGGNFTESPEITGSFLLPIWTDNVTTGPVVTFGSALLEDVDDVTGKPVLKTDGTEKTETDVEGDKETRITVPPREIKAYEASGNETKNPGLAVEMEFVPLPVTTEEPITNDSYDIVNAPDSSQVNYSGTENATTTLSSDRNTTTVSLLPTEALTPEPTDLTTNKTESWSSTTIPSTTTTTFAISPATGPTTMENATMQAVPSVIILLPNQPENQTTAAAYLTSTTEASVAPNTTQAYGDSTSIEATWQPANTTESSTVISLEANVNDVNIVVQVKTQPTEAPAKLISSLSYDLGPTSGMYGSYFINSEFLDQVNRTVYQAVAHRIHAVNTTWGSLAHIATAVEFSGLSATAKSVGPQITVHITVNNQPAFTITDFRSIVDDALFRGRLIFPAEAGKTANLHSDLPAHSPWIIIFMALLGAAIVILVGIIIILARRPRRRCLRSPFTESDLNNTTSRSCSLAASSYENPVFLEPRSPYVADEENISLEPSVYAEAHRNGCGEIVVKRMIFSPKIGCHGSHPSISQRTTTTFEQRSSGGTL